MIRRTSSLLLVAALAAATAGCAGDDADDAAVDRRPTTTTTAPATTTTEAPPTTTSTTAALDVAPEAAATPEGLAEQIVTAEGVIRDDAATDEQVAIAAHLQQVVYRTLSGRPEWDEAVAARLPAELRPVMAANVRAARELRQLVRRPRETMPAWRIVAPAPADELRRYYEEAEAAFGVPWQYLAAVHLTETRMGRIRGVSTAGAQGPMQFLPSTWEAYGEGDINDNRDAIMAAGRYLAANGGADGRLQDALYRYNPTPRYVNAVTEYAEQMRADERAYRGYYHWQVYYVTTVGDIWLRVGYEATEERPVTPEDAG